MIQPAYKMRNPKVPGPPASGAAYSPKGNSAAIRSRPFESPCENRNVLSGHDFSHAENAANSIRLQPLNVAINNKC
jgi:hypothetical protein